MLAVQRKNKIKYTENHNAITIDFPSIHANILYGTMPNLNLYERRKYYEKKVMNESSARISIPSDNGISFLSGIICRMMENIFWEM